MITMHRGGRRYGMHDRHEQQSAEPDTEHAHHDIERARHDAGKRSTS